MALTPLDYLRWLRAMWRRIPEDVRYYQRRRDWWKKGVYISPTVIIRMAESARLEIGRGSAIGEYTALILENDPNAVTSVTAVLKIGQHTTIGEFNNIRAGGGEIVIGSHCMISQFVSIIASSHSTARGAYMVDQPWNTTNNRVHIGDDVWIGTHAVILPGVTIGAGSVIGAGAVVTSDIPEYAIAVGMPAEVKRFR
jgi:acetyltransferase-like isoleucine patch superfamily enzyme